MQLPIRGFGNRLYRYRRRFRDWILANIFFDPPSTSSGIVFIRNPVSRVFGLDRGTPIDRYYIEKFLRMHAEDIRGTVLEVGDPGYTRRFGGQKVIRVEVLHAVPGNPHATLVGDLASGNGIPENTFDCIILTQTLQFIYDVPGAVRSTYRALKPGGMLLATVPGISQISRYDMDRWGEYWRFTSLSAKRIFSEVFFPGDIHVQSHGNILAATSFLSGIAAEELNAADLDEEDPDYEVLITISALKTNRRDS